MKKSFLPACASKIRPAYVSVETIVGLVILTAALKTFWSFREEISSSRFDLKRYDSDFAIQREILSGIHSQADGKKAFIRSERGFVHEGVWIEVRKNGNGYRYFYPRSMQKTREEND